MTLELTQREQERLDRMDAELQAEPRCRAFAKLLIALEALREAEVPWLHVEYLIRSCTEMGFPIQPTRQAKLRALRYEEYLRSPEWKAKRERAVNRAGGACQTCGSHDFLEVHHRTYENLPVELPQDLVALCSACHTAVHLVVDARKGKTRPTSKRARI